MCIMYVSDIDKLRYPCSISSLMPPKKESNSGNNFLVDGEEDKILQAVVIADSFNERFMPITLDKPRVI